MVKRLAMSTMGYAIVSVIILGIIMIVSAPLLVENAKTEKAPEAADSFEQQEAPSEIQMLEERLSSRIDSLEHRQPQDNSVKNKYVCVIEGNLDENGNVVSVDSPNRTEKFVFVCEYRH